MSKAKQSADDEVEQFEIAHKDDLDTIEMKQDSVEINHIDSEQRFRLYDHETGWCVHFSGVERKNGKWNFKFKRDDYHSMVRTNRDFPVAISVVLGRIAELADE